jgi:sugar phosphate isomerase/epimerase
MTKSSKMTDKEWCFINYPLGIFSWFGFVLPFEERITLIKEAGFTATSIWWEDEVAPFPIKKESMPHLAREQGLLLENIHVPYNNSDALWSEHESLRKAIVQCHVEWLYDCAQFGIPMMVMHLNDEINPPAPNSQGLENMRELVQVAEKMQVTIAIENTRRNDSISYVLKSIRSNYLGFCFDSSHHRLANNEDCRLLNSC